MGEHDGRVGITATLPVEVLFAAGRRPVDLNNLFLAGGDGGADVAVAEEAGFPRTTCAWIKGIYGAVKREGIRSVAVVTGGDCSNAQALGEVLRDDGVDVVPFNFPADKDAAALRREITSFAAVWDTTAAAAEEVFAALRPTRALLRELDDLTWGPEGRVTGRENYAWLVASSDFGGDPSSFHARLEAFVAEARKRPPRRTVGCRLGLIGVPPIVEDLFEVCREWGAEVVFNEVPRQFSLPRGNGLVEAYAAYTYPYDLRLRLADILTEVRRRRLSGVIHYVQSFCHRGIQDVVLRRHIPVPVLTFEGESPGPVTAQQRLRLETFVAVVGSAREKLDNMSRIG